MAKSRPPEEIYPDGPIRTLKLAYPKAKLTWTELKFWRRLDVADMIAMEDEGYVGKRYTVDALRRLCLVSTSDLHLMDAYDFVRADEVLHNFLSSGPDEKSESSESQ
jgi:hypothetical protein